MSLQMAQGVSLVTANTRVARHLRGHADRQQAASGDLSWPSVDILPWSAWLERLWRGSLIADSDAGHFDLLSDQQSRLIWQNLTATIPVPDLPGTGDFSSAISLLINAWRLSNSWDIPLDDVSRGAAGPDSQAFAKWAREYTAVCRERLWIDTAMVPELLREDLASGRIKLAQPLAFVGFNHFTPQQVRMRQTIDSMGLLRAAPRSQIGQSRCNAVACEDQQHEFELAARWSRRLIDDKTADTVGVVVPEGAVESARRIFLDVFCADWRSRPCADLPVNAAVEKPLGDIGIIHIALLLLGLPRGVFSYSSLGQLLRSPYLHGGEDESMQRASLDVDLREQGLQQIDVHRFFAHLSAAHDDSPAPVFVGMVSRAATWQQKLSGRHEPGHWAGEMTQLLQDLGWPKGRNLSSDEQQATESWARLLDSFAACSPMIGSITFGEAHRLLRRMAAEQRFQLEGRMDGVQIMTAAQAPGHYFDGLWICGLSSDAWPPMPNANPLVPLFLQRERGIPQASPQGIREAAESTMTGLLASSPRVMASWPRLRDEENLVPSPVLEPLTRVAMDSLTIHTAPTFREQIYAARKIETLSADPPPPLQEMEQVRGGSYLLKNQSLCPARAFFEARLGVRELPVPPHGLDALTRGNIVHDALAFLYARISDTGAISDVTDEQAGSWIETAANHSLRKHLPARHPLARTLGSIERRRVQKLLHEVVLLDRARPDFRPLAVESSDSVELGPLILSVRQDRIDFLGDSGRLLIDYKTGAGITSNAWRGVRPVEPQLPLYAATGEAMGIAVMVLNQDGVKLTGVGAENTGISGIKTAAEFTGESTATWEGLLGEWKVNLLALANEFAAGDCRINGLDIKLADGGFAMLTRIHDRSAANNSEAEE